MFGLKILKQKPHDPGAGVVVAEIETTKRGDDFGRLGKEFGM